VEGEIEIEAGGDEAVLDGAEALRTLGVMRAHFVTPAVAMGDEGRGHVGIDIQSIGALIMNLFSSILPQF
jgi:hypothetical protein